MAPRVSTIAVQVIFDENQKRVKTWKEEGGSMMVGGAMKIRCSASVTVSECIAAMQEFLDKCAEDYVSNHRVRDVFKPFFYDTQIQALTFEGEPLEGSSTLESCGIKDSLGMTVAVQSGETCVCCVGAMAPAGVWVKGATGPAYRLGGGPAPKNAQMTRM